MRSQQKPILNFNEKVSGSQTNALGPRRKALKGR